MSKPTIGLCVIAEKQTSELNQKLVDLKPYFDAIYVQLNGKGPHPGRTIEPHLKDWQYFEWNDNFSDARNALLKEVKTDYWTWMDTDDDIAGVEDIPAAVEHMERSGTDILFAPYLYQIDDKGNPTEVQNRERIVRTILKGEWKGAIHETFIPEEACFQDTTDRIQWVHRKSKEEHKESMERNRRILESEYRAGHDSGRPDPRTAYYLGLNYGMDGQYERAIECFTELISTGGWDEERYRAHLQIFSCYFEMGRYQDAINAALEATTELPEYPDAYFMLQQAYYQVDDYKKSIEWYKVGKSKPIPKSDSAFNPIVRTEQPIYLAATAQLFLGEPQLAMKLLLELQRINPSYEIPESVRQTTLDAVNEAGAIDNAKALIAFNQKYEGDALAILNSLPSHLRADIRLTKERRELIPGKKWDDKSIAIYCGASFETWGPDTLDKGMGGSEEAIVYLSEEFLSKKYEVTVFNERTSPYRQASQSGGSVWYKPWPEINPNDIFDTFVCWRDPTIAKEIRARKVLCDLHDIIPVETVYAAIPHVDMFMFKSKYHRGLYPEVPDDKCFVVGNGIDTEQFK